MSASGSASELAVLDRRLEDAEEAASKAGEDGGGEDKLIVSHEDEDSEVTDMVSVVGRGVWRLEFRG